MLLSKCYVVKWVKNQLLRDKQTETYSSHEKPCGVSSLTLLANEPASACQLKYLIVHLTTMIKYDTLNHFSDYFCHSQNSFNIFNREKVLLNLMQQAIKDILWKMMPEILIKFFMYLFNFG